jgi:DNA-binding FadR family transcriptional regulator
MPMTTAERMAKLRARQRAAGLASLSLVVPAGDAAAFARLAARRRALHRAGRTPGTTLRWSREATRLRSTSISVADILAFRELLESTAVTLAVRRMSAASARLLRAELAREAALPVDASSADWQRLHLLLGELSGDEGLQLLLRIALQLTDERSAFTRSTGADRAEVVARVKRLHAGIVDAVIARSEALAVRRVRRYLAGLREWLE